ncbi:DUF4489 domain-containing protein [Alkaliphilus serpentinus]|uniref:DUF4489 domain-containing protein n=1 Tax=Alkaliphilus serpentinus TaxID=1482731 RepID=A0A833HQN8_9FIRM|nr:DUF4489 domain-containing protein [Alkaliphilus serpentinus]KAB3532172.1 DUF4489 domain-containing protein [Alkaliphilus serpentinus]
MRRVNYSPHVKCGKIYQIDLPYRLDESEPPIVLAEVNVNTKDIPMPCILVKFSEFINFTLLGLNPKFNIIYRLVREDRYLSYPQILKEWEFEFESSEMLEIANVDTNQPTVLDYCDCLDRYTSGRITYRLEIVQIETNNVTSYGLTNKSFTAIVINGLKEEGKRHNSYFLDRNLGFIPYVKCGKVFDPVLPIKLSKEDPPVILTQLIINTERNNDLCILINFSSFVTSILKEDHFNNLTFRLVKSCSDFTTQVLREWPFRRVFVNDTNIKEPLVYDYCECLNSKFDRHCTYTFALVEAELSEKSFYNISQKSMTAKVYSGKHQQGLC